MKRFVVLAIAGFLGAVALSAPAYAGAIVLPDPTVGIRGSSDPPAPNITDGSANLLTPCSSFSDFGVDLTGIEGFFCAPYAFTGNEGYGSDIFSVDLAFWDNTGQPIEELCGDGCTFNASEQSQFPSANPVEGQPFLVRLSTGVCEFGCDIIADPENPDNPTNILVFVEEAAFNGGHVSLQAINGSNTFQTNLATPGQPLVPTPEPGTLVLVASGLATVFARQRRKRQEGASQTS
jgi:hypothetical protein